MSGHVSWTSSILNSSIEGTPWGDDCMDLLDFKNSSEWLGGKDVGLEVKLFLEDLEKIGKTIFQSRA
jgi:hypothetical protein